MKWKLPPPIKIYEALGAIGDQRVEVIGADCGKVYSSSRNKYYNVVFGEHENAIMSNDNGSYWKEYLGYPSIAFLMAIDKLPFNEACSKALRDIPWKDINTFYKNDFEKTQEHVNGLLKAQDINVAHVKKYIGEVLDAIQRLDLDMFGNKVRPPEAY